MPRSDRKVSWDVELPNGAKSKRLACGMIEAAILAVVADRGHPCSGDALCSPIIVQRSGKRHSHRRYEITLEARTRIDWICNPFFTVRSRA